MKLHWNHLRQMHWGGYCREPKSMLCPLSMAYVSMYTLHFCNFPIIFANYWDLYLCDITRGSKIFNSSSYYIFFLLFYFNLQYFACALTPWEYFSAFVLSVNRLGNSCTSHQNWLWHRVTHTVQSVPQHRGFDFPDAWTPQRYKSVANWSPRQPHLSPTISPEVFPRQVCERSAGSVACAVSHAESRESGRAGRLVRVSYGERPWEPRGGHGATTHRGDWDELLPCVSTPFSSAGTNALTRHRLRHILNLFFFLKRHMQVRPTDIAKRRCSYLHPGYSKFYPTEILRRQMRNKLKMNQLWGERHKIGSEMGFSRLKEKKKS